ncbi:MAG: NAD(P)-dependent oxidoreductase [Methanomicrobiaceae archaeon]|nr:NAD(P)-dependent oxidoreductase [Methanomicrobiaceae archaeon]
MTTDLLEIKGRKIVLIGGAGFIGHNLALELKAQGADVEIIDSLQVNNLLSFTSAEQNGLQDKDLYLLMLNQRLDELKKADIPLNIQDARDYHALSRMLSAIKPDVIVHLAAVAHANKSNKDPHSTFDHSLRTLENALDYAKNESLHFIYISSSMVYGNFLTPEVTEESPLNSLGIYGALKVAGERMVVAYNQVFNLPYTIIRPSALYGPRCVSRRVGQIFIENAMKGKNLRIDGDGNERLDFTYVDDLVSGIIQVIRHPAARKEIFNLTYGESRSLNDLSEIILKEFPGVDTQYVERDNLMPFRGTLSVDKARKLIGYNPQNPIEIGFPKYIQWYKSLDPSGDIWKKKD